MDNFSTVDSSRIVVGIDVGTTKIATVIGYCDEDGKICVAGHGKCNSYGVEYGVIRNINKTVEGIDTSKQIAMQRANLPVTHAYSGIAGRHIKSREYRHTLYRRNGKDEIIQQEEIDRMHDDVEHVSVDPGERIISVMPQRFVIDNERETAEPVGELGETITGYFQIITGNETEIKRIVRCLNASDIEVDKIILEPIASGLSCLTEEDRNDGVALVDIGGGTTDVSIFKNGNPVFSQVIPIGGNLITKDIATICKIPEELAEKLKISYGTCIESYSNANNLITIPQFRGRDAIQIGENYLAKIIHSRATETLKTVQNEINLSGYADKLTGGIVLTGGGANLRHLKELCQYSMHMPARIGIPNIGFAHSMTAELKHPMFATALGLLKYGIGVNDSQRIDTEDIARRKTGKPQKKRSKGNKSFAIFDVIQKFVDDILEKTS